MFSKRLREIRSKKGISQYRLAKISGIPQPQISNYEAGKLIPTIFTAECLCVALGVTATELLGF